MFKFSSGSVNQQPKFFDIRIQSPHKNSLIIYGQSQESAPVLLSGHVVFSLPEKLTVKKVSLNLVGNYKLDFLETYQSESKKRFAANAVKAETCIFRCDWDNLLNSPEGKIHLGNYGDKTGFGYKQIDISKVTRGLNELLDSPSTPGSATSSSYPIPPALKSFGSKSKIKPIVIEFGPNIPMGETPFPGTESNTVNNENLLFSLPKGNYSLPFQIILPGNIPETVEGLQYGSILYRFESKLELPNAKHLKYPIHSFKYIRIFRTFATSDIIVNEDCSIENSWPNKIQYEVRIPRKAVPLGGKTKIHILIIPLVKGLKLGKMSASIQQYFMLSGPKGEIFEDEKTVYKCELPEVSMDSLNPDRWSLEAKISMPKKLKQCSQDVNCKDNLIKIRHKLVLNVNLINPDGHTSQVKSKLPIIVYISAKEPIIARNAYIDPTGKVRFKTGHYPLFENSLLLTESETSSVPAASQPSSSSRLGSFNSTHNSQPQSATSPSEIPSGLSQSSATEERVTELYADPDYEYGNQFEPDDEDNPHADTSDFLPSYKDSGRDILFTPEILSSGYASPLLSSGQQTPSYFDIDPSHNTAHNIINSGMGNGVSSPALQFLSRVNSSTALHSTPHTPLFSSSLNEVPSYHAVYDDDIVDSDVPAPLYSSIDKSSLPSSPPIGLPSNHNDSELADYLLNKVMNSQIRKVHGENGNSSTSIQGCQPSSKSRSHTPIPIPPRIAEEDSPPIGISLFGMSPSTKSLSSESSSAAATAPAPVRPLLAKMRSGSSSKSVRNCSSTDSNSTGGNNIGGFGGMANGIASLNWESPSTTSHQRTNRSNSPAFGGIKATFTRKSTDSNMHK